MVPIVFPYTYLSRSTLDVCQEWFEEIVIYQPSGLDIPEYYKKNERLIIKAPLASHLDFQKFKQERLYLKSLENEAGPNLDHLKARSEDLPFFDESSVNRIRAQIKQKKDDRTDDKLLLIALYCQLFQEFDMQQADLDRTLAEIDQSHKRLFQQLNNEVSSPSPEPNMNDNKLINNIQDRLKIWFYLYQYDKAASGVLVTDNRDVILEIQEWNDDLELIFRIDESKMANAKQLLQDYLDIPLHQLSSAPVKTKKILLYHKKNPMVGPFIPSNLTTCENILMIVLE